MELPVNETIKPHESGTAHKPERRQGLEQLKSTVWKRLPAGLRNLYLRWFTPEAIAPEQTRARMQVKKIETRLSRFSLVERAEAELQRLADHSPDRWLRREAAWRLALQQANRDSAKNLEQALHCLAIAGQGEFNRPRLNQIVVIKVECMNRFGKPRQARRLLARATRKNQDPNLALAAVNLEEQAEARLCLINRVLERHGLLPVTAEFSPDKSPLDRLDATKASAASSRGQEMQSPKVSVLMPARNAAATIDTALRSICRQTWKNWETIVVDDASTDETAAAVKAWSERDPRIRLLQAERNLGAYAARNRALLEADGELVTVHDADDWSHPEKLERQVRHLLANPQLPGNLSQAVRIDGDLRLQRRPRAGVYLFDNLSSLLFRREKVMEKLGFWDSVRFGADDEFMERFRQQFGDSALAIVDPAPLALVRVSPQSLTGHSRFGIRKGAVSGARREYVEVQNFHRHRSGIVRYPFPMDERPFPVPEPMWLEPEPKPGGRRHFDLILASDFRLPAGTSRSNAEEIKVQQKLGLRTGLLHLPRYDLNPDAPINSAIRKLVDGDRVQFIVAGEKIDCDLLVVRHPPILGERREQLPEIRAKTVAVVVNQTPRKDYGRHSEISYELESCRKNLEESFGQPGIWYPNSPLTRQALLRHHAPELANTELAAEDWCNIIDVDEWRCDRRRARPGHTVRIGRISRDDWRKWPTDPKQLLAAYPPSPRHQICVLGGAQSAQKLLGRLPDNWQVAPLGSRHPREFLRELDVFVYFTAPELVETFSRSILESMAVGIPVVTHPNQRELFREAALYALPEQAAEVVDGLMAEPARYREQVETARDFVRHKFGHEHHIRRLRQLLPIPPPPSPVLDCAKCDEAQAVADCNLQE